MEAQIHLLEQEAYTAVLRAFEAQSDAISWGLITELRKELRVSDDEHRELLSRVNKDDTIGRIRSVVGDIRAVSSNSRVVPGGVSANESAEALIGRKVWTKWSEDNNFYEAIITQYNAVEISPEDISWDGEENGAALNVGVGSGSTRGNRRNQSHFGRGRGPRIHQPKNEFVERVFESRNPDLFELDKAKKMLKEHEQALIDAIAGLADTSDGEIGNNNKSRASFCLQSKNNLLFTIQFCTLMIIPKVNYKRTNKHALKSFFAQHQMEIHHFCKTIQYHRDDGRA
ncbi:hypothetical protein DY000_02050838 [Brassica cretica]|uniref:ENT domain-containing protein n=1 Tax=Brassica cretica TaxID=69181 RepID=A0ABQ7EU64_BRACR|nr:hypothetical protein DY000_02050838 [Brassica cretica]